MKKIFSTLVITSFLIAASQFALAGSATWNLNPNSGDWNTAADWTPATVPNGPSDIATLGSSNTTDISLSAITEVSGITYSAGADAFTTTVPDGITLTISGTGIANNSGMMQNFVASATASNGGVIKFLNNASAGSLTTFVNQGGAAVNKEGGILLFENSSSAGAATIMTNGAAVTNGFGALTAFHDDSTAGEATIIANTATARTISPADISFLDNSTAGNSKITIKASTAGTPGGFIEFSNNSTAGNATITLERNLTGPGFVTSLYFRDSSTAGDATIVLEGSPGRGAGSTIQFFGGNGGSARLEIFGQSSAGAGTGGSAKSWGSIEGDGTVFVGSPSLAIGSNNLSTTFTGLLADAFQVGPLVKVGTGTLTLGGANTYTEGTTISSGALITSNTTGSATGTATVNVTGGTLGGGGIISGPVTVGTGSGTGASLAPAFGSTNQVTLTLQSSLTLQIDATYTYSFKARNNEARNDLVIANGVTINGAKIKLKAKTQGTLTPGLVITVISNTSASPTSGTFSNLTDGGTVVIGGNTFQANYEGGDGNDLTLTVVP